MNAPNFKLDIAGGTSFVAVIADGHIRSLEAVERAAVKAALDHAPSVSAACKALGMGRSTLYRKYPSLVRAAQRRGEFSAEALS